MAYMIKDYRKAVGDGAERTFKKVCEIKCKHSPVSSWDEMVSKRSITCSSSGSIALQLGGCMDKGKKMGHVLVKGTGIKPSSITSIKKAMYGVENIRHCRLIWVNCYYKDLPVWLRQRGVIYIYSGATAVPAPAGEATGSIMSGPQMRKADITVSRTGPFDMISTRRPAPDPAYSLTVDIIHGEVRSMYVSSRKRSGCSTGPWKLCSKSMERKRRGRTILAYTTNRSRSS